MATTKKPTFQPAPTFGPFNADLDVRPDGSYTIAGSLAHPGKPSTSGKTTTVATLGQYGLQVPHEGQIYTVKVTISGPARAGTAPRGRDFAARAPTAPGPVSALADMTPEQKAALLALLGK